MSQHVADEEHVRHCRVRTRVDADLDPCVDVLAQVHERDRYPLTWPQDPVHWLRPPGLLAAWVAECDGQVVGQVCLARSGEGDLAPLLLRRRTGTTTEAGVVSRLYLSPVARGHGAGALLMGRAADAARARGLHPVLDVVASDASAVRLYDRLGWVRLGREDQQWGPDRTVTVHCFAEPGRGLGP